MCIDGKYMLAIRISTWISNSAIFIIWIISLNRHAMFRNIFPHNHPGDPRNPSQSNKESLASPSTMTTSRIEQNPLSPPSILWDNGYPKNMLEYIQSLVHIYLQNKRTELHHFILQRVAFLIIIDLYLLWSSHILCMCRIHSSWFKSWMSHSLYMIWLIWLASKIHNYPLPFHDEFT